MKFIFAFLFCTQTQALTITNAFIRLVPPAAPTTMATMEMTNDSNEDIILQSISGNISSSIEIHEMKMDQGTMKMRQLHSITIKAHQKMTFKSGDHHLMIFNYKGPLKLKQQHDLLLHFNHGKDQKVIFEVADF